MLTVGFLTRLAAAAQIPILAGAVFFVHRKDGLFAMGQSLELLGPRAVPPRGFPVSGAGPWSMDRTIFGASEPAGALPPH